MEKIAEISMLIDFYGKLLTQKQYDIIDMYYNNDYSLSEISEILGISRQGVRDSLKRSEAILYEYEEKLRLASKFVMQRQSIKNTLNKLKKIERQSQDKKKMIEIIRDLEILITDNDLDTELG